jgi:hypothetical protein
MDEEKLFYDFESSSFQHAENSVDDRESLFGHFFMRDLSGYPAGQEYGTSEFQLESEPAKKEDLTLPRSQSCERQSGVALLRFDLPQEEQLSVDFTAGESEERVVLDGRPAMREESELIDLLAQAVQAKEISAACWSQLGPRGQAVTVAWLLMEINKDKKKTQLESLDSGADLHYFTNGLLKDRTPKRTDLYKRTFYKSFIQYLLGKYTKYKHTKSYKIKPFMDSIAGRFFSSSNKHEEEELGKIFQNTKHFSIPNLKKLFSASAEFRGEFDLYMQSVLKEDTEKEVKEFCKRLLSQQSRVQTEVFSVIPVAQSIVVQRTLIPWTAFDVEAAQEIYQEMTEKASR